MVEVLETVQWLEDRPILVSLKEEAFKDKLGIVSELRQKMLSDSIGYYNIINPLSQ
jgi:hypothetical protein